MAFTPSYEMTVLLGLGFRTIVENLHAQLAALGYDDVRPAHGFAFVRLSQDGGNGATGNELAEFLDITKQAASEMVDYLERHGYVTRQPHPTDRRGKMIMLTERGWNCIRETEAILSHLEMQWTAVLGASHMEELRANLRQLIAVTNGGTLPQKFRPAW